MGSRLVRFLSVVSLLLIYTAYKALQIWPAQQLVAVLLTLPLFFLMLGGTFIYRSRPQVFETLWFQVLAWAGCLTMGVWGTFILLSLPFDLLRLLFGWTSWAQRVSGGIPFSSPFALGLLILSGAMGGLGLLQVLWGPRVREVSIAIENLPASLRGLKIAQITDLHIGPTIRQAYAETIVSRVNATAPDLIFITGDIADAQAVSILHHMAPLGQLKAHLGVFYVTGNHEYYWGAETLIEKMKSFGIIPLLNENRVLQRGDAKLLVAGVTDPMGAQMIEGHQPDLKKALRSEQETSLKILLAHRPDPYLEAEPLGFHLQFSGHTHAGQFFPFNLLIGLAHKYYRGLHRYGRLWLYVNPGTGYWGPANRFGVASEITLAQLI